MWRLQFQPRPLILLASLNDLEPSINLIIAAQDDGWIDIKKISDATDKLKAGQAHLAQL